MKSLDAVFSPRRLLAIGLLVSLGTGCQKHLEPVTNTGDDLLSSSLAEQGHLKQTKTYSAGVIVSWLNLQLDLLRVPLAPGTGTQGADRAMAYCGIAVYEAVVGGMPAYQSLAGQLTDFPAMPQLEAGKAYYWPASANAALAEMNRKLFPTTSQGNKTKIEELELALRTKYASETDALTLERSISYGKAIAEKVFAWAAVDGSANVNPPYVPPPGDGFWESTPPNFPAAANPYAKQRRLLVPAITIGTEIAPPPPYSTDPASPFFAMVKEVYDRSKTLTKEDSATAIYHRDAPGYPGGGHFVAVLSQVLVTANSTLDVAARLYAKIGIGFHDAATICFIDKYTINLLRPITYIHKVMNKPEWNALFNTPGHPEFPSAHGVVSAAVAAMLTNELGNELSFTLHTYDYLGLPARSFTSFDQMSKEMADSRMLAGIHYQASCDKGRWLGNKVSTNALALLRFTK